MKKYILSLGIVALTVVGSLPARAEGTSFLAILSGGEEVPANASRARGIAIFRLADDGTTVNYSITVANLENPVVAHIHPGLPGTNGAPEIHLFGGPAGTGRFSGVLVEGSFTASADFLQKMVNGEKYVNVHTNDGVAPDNTGPGDLKGGELRGQIFPVGTGDLE